MTIPILYIDFPGGKRNLKMNIRVQLMQYSDMETYEYEHKKKSKA